MVGRMTRRLRGPDGLWRRRGVGSWCAAYPPRSPRLNGRVERAHRHREEFYEVADLGRTVAGGTVTNVLNEYTH